MKVYAVYGYGYGEVFCDEAFDTFDKALKYISDEFSGFITESVEDGTLDSDIAAVVLLRLVTWVGTMYFTRPSDAAFEYNDPDDDSTGIIYRIAELEIK